jgi:hypothetical protein
MLKDNTMAIWGRVDIVHHLRMAVGPVHGRLLLADVEHPPLLFVVTRCSSLTYSFHSS